MEPSKGNPHSEMQNNEISLKELIIKLQQLFKILWRKKLVIIIAVVIGGLLGLGASLLSDETYVAELTFVLEANNDSPFSAYASLAGQFGIDLGGKSESSIFEGDNIMEFLKSRLIVEKALLSPVAVSGEKVTLAECYIKFKKLRKKWAGRKDKFDVKYPVGQDRKAFSLAQDSILNVMQDDLVRHYLVIDKVDKKLSFIEVKLKSPMEEFSKGFTETLVREAIEFYTDTKTMRTKTNVQRLQTQADSLKLLLNRKTYDAAAIQDFNLNPAKVVAGVGAEIGMRDKMVLQAMYLEIAKNLEISKIAMERETPVIQIVDSPILPLVIEKLGKIKGIVIGGMLLGFIATMVVLLRSFWAEVMRGE
ncbi:Wzz/FepE/Etk N-terminal domain-containing protein [Chitinophaga sp. CC14]|uniref:Wzz/FepE/Etk N-terminal domain-containing protein n=1 Tax=Chitinophaga sp. CC14 TaxID=3029199 RepID=UPI003B766566